MSVRQVGFGHWYSTLAEQTFDSQAAALHYDNLERMKSTAESEGDKFLASLTPEQIRKLDAAARLQADQVERSIDWKHVQQEFVNANPDYLPNEVNGRTLYSTLVALGKLDPVADVFVGTMDDLREGLYRLGREEYVAVSRGGSGAAESNSQ